MIVDGGLAQVLFPVTTTRHGEPCIGRDTQIELLGISPLAADTLGFWIMDLRRTQDASKHVPDSQSISRQGAVPRGGTGVGAESILLLAFTVLQPIDDFSRCRVSGGSATFIRTVAPASAKISNSCFIFVVISLSLSYSLCNNVIELVRVPSIAAFFHVFSFSHTRLITE